MRILIAAFLFALGALNPVTAQVLWRAADHVTPGGLAFRYVKLPRGQTQAIQFGWQDGWAARQTNGKGIAVFGPALVMQGPQGSSHTEFAEDVKDTQGQMYLASTPEYTIGGVFAPPQKFPAALKLLAKTIADPAMDPARLEDLRKLHLAAITQASTQPVVMANRVGAHILWNDPVMLGWTRDDPAHFTGTTLGDLEAWRQSVIRREGLMIAAAGPATWEEAAIDIDRLFSDLPAKGQQASERPSLSRKDFSVSVLLEANVPQTMVLIGGWSGFGKGSDQMVGVIGARALQKRLFGEIRENMGASYSVSAQLVPLIADPVVFSMNTSVAHDRAAEVLSIMRRQHSKFLTDGISQNELDAEKLALRTESEEAFRRPPQVAAFLRDAMLSGHPLNHVEKFLDRLSALSLAEVNSVLKAGLAGKQISTVVVGPPVDRFPGFCVINAAEEISQCKEFR